MGKLKREIESLLITAQNNIIKTNDVQEKLDKTQQNSKRRLSGEGYERINYIVSRCRKLGQKEYKTRHDWVSKVIHWKLCKKLKFDHTNKWYTHKPEFVLENEIRKIL